MRRILSITALVLAGEMVFSLPFHTNRFFRPTFLDAFELTNTQLGDVFAVYGLIALLSYFPGGVVADRFSARGLLCASLALTALGGVYMATIPSALGLAVLYGFWGFTSIFLFWSALIRATRDWGGSNTQGMAFGVLESGRGLAAASFGALGVWILAAYLPQDPTTAAPVEREQAMRSVIVYYSLLTLLVAAMVRFMLPPSRAAQAQHLRVLEQMRSALHRPVLWAQSGIIVFAYCAYKGVDNYSLYAVQVLGMNEVQAAQVTAWGSYLRPIAALAAGLLADRIRPSRAIVLSFAVMIVTYSALGFATPDNAGLFVIFANLAVGAFAIFGLRGVYFALLEEGRTPKFLTGTAVGFVSFIGFTPELFFGPISGRILDATPGAGGHLNLFLFLAATAAGGLLMTLWLLRMYRRAETNSLTPGSPETSDAQR